MATIYRYKFSPGFMSHLETWVSIHKFDDNEIFLENWLLWCRKNEMIIENEREKLIKDGYKKDIYDKIHKYTGIPIVFDYHHHRFCTGGQTEEEALKLAASTWPAGVKPVVHLSESRAVEYGDPKIKPQAHSDYVKKSVKNYGQVYDMMLECKKKELGLIEYRSVFNRMKRKTA